MSIRIPDSRMLWIHNAEALKSKPAVETMEAELASEAEINGFLGYSSDSVICNRWTFQRTSHGLYKYRLKLGLPPEVDEMPAASREGYFFREGPVGELAALFSLQFEARIYILSTTITIGSSHIKTEYEPIRGQCGADIDGVVFSNRERNFTTALPPFLDTICRIQQKHHLSVALAAHHYARALREVGVDDEMVFVRLVSAIETAAHEQPIPNELFAGKRLEDLLKTELLSEGEREDLEKTFAVRKAKARFIAFLEQYSAGFFDGEAIEPIHTQVTPQSLARVAGAIYDARSGYLHSGTMMYLSNSVRGFPQWHMDPSVGMTWQNRRFRASEKLPRIEFFHRLVRHCLLGFFGQLANEGSAN